VFLLPFEDIVIFLMKHNFSYSEILHMRVTKIKVYVQKLLVLEEEQERRLRAAQN